MRRTFVLTLAALALVGVVTPSVYAQAPGAPAPTFKITGFVDELMTYSNNVSNIDGDLHRIDKQWYGRTRGRFDIIGEYGKAKVVMGLELDFVYGRAGTANTNIVAVGQGASAAPGGSTVATQFGTDGGFGLNTDVRGILEIKWLYTEFEVPFMPVPTVARLGGQPFGADSTYKLAVYSASDFSGVNITSTITPNVKLLLTYVQVQENLTGREAQNGVAFGVNPFQLQGDDWAFILSPEVTPFKGLDIKPMYSYFTASGTTDGNARQPRGGITDAWFVNNAGGAGINANGTWRKGVNEDRHTVGLDARYRMGPFSLDPTVMYQFGNRSVVAPSVASGAFPAAFADAGVVPGRKYTANLDAWLLDVRGGFQLGPLLLEAMYMYTTGNSARNTTLGTVRSYQPLTTDTSYLADWGGQLTALGVDYLNALIESGIPIPYPGVSIGWDKYGRHQAGARATYAWTPALSTYFGVNVHFTDQGIQRHAGTGAGTLIPVFKGNAYSDKYLGTELFGGVTWRFAPAIAWDNAGGYMFMGPAMDALTNSGTTAAGLFPRDAKDSYILTSRIRVTF